MKKYIAGTVAHWNEDYKLFYVHVGLNDRNKTLVCTAWGSSEAKALRQARTLAEVYNSLPEQYSLTAIKN